MSIDTDGDSGAVRRWSCRVRFRMATMKVRSASAQDCALEVLDREPVGAWNARSFRVGLVELHGPGTRCDVRGEKFAREPAAPTNEEALSLTKERHDLCARFVAGD